MNLSFNVASYLQYCNYDWSSDCTSIAALLKHPSHTLSCLVLLSNFLIKGKTKSLKKNIFRNLTNQVHSNFFLLWVRSDKIANFKIFANVNSITFVLFNC